MKLWLIFYKYALMTSLMSSPGHNLGQFLKLVYSHQHFVWSADQRLSMSEICMVILLVYSTSGITSGKIVCRDLKMAAILNFKKKYFTHFQCDLRYEKTVPNYTKSIFHGDDVIDDVARWLQSFPLYSCLGEVGSGGKLHGKCLISKYKYRNRLSGLYMPKENINE